MPHPFDPVRDRLQQMQTCLSGPSVDLIAIAKAYAALGEAMLEATRQSGQTSMRFEAAAKALRLTTSKSALQAFVQSR